jgi:penicillin amidase
MQKIQLDVISAFHPILAKKLVQIIGEDKILTMSQTHRTAAAALKIWDGSHRTTDLAPSIYYRLLAWTFRMAIEDELGEKTYQALVNTHLFKNSYMKFISDSNSGWWDNINTAAERETRAQIVTKAFLKTIEELNEYSPRTSEWGWSGFHTITHNHPVGNVKPLNRIFNVGPGPAAGGMETINNASFNLTTGEKFPVTYGPAMRDLIDLRTPETALSISPTGQSGHVRSPHYSDQFQMHLSGLYRPMLLNRNDIEKNSLNELTFKPAK